MLRDLTTQLNDGRVYDRDLPALTAEIRSLPRPISAGSTSGTHLIGADLRLRVLSSDPPGQLEDCWGTGLLCRGSRRLPIAAGTGEALEVCRPSSALPHVAAYRRPPRQHPGVPVDLDELQVSRAAVVTVAQAASVFGVDARTVARAIENGELPAVRLGRRVLIPRLPLLAVLGVTADGPVT